MCRTRRIAQCILGLQDLSRVVQQGRISVIADAEKKIHSLIRGRRNQCKDFTAQGINSRNRSIVVFQFFIDGSLSKGIQGKLKIFSIFRRHFQQSLFVISTNIYAAAIFPTQARIINLFQTTAANELRILQLRIFIFFEIFS